MVRALRVVTVERGIDPRRFALLPFGGAGPMHAAAIAAELGIERILCPRAGGVLSALGLCASDRRRDTARTVMLSGEELSAERIAAEVDELIAGRSAATSRGQSPRSSTRCATRARPSSCRSPGPTDPDPADLVERFEQAHEERYGHRDPDGEVVLVHIRLAMVAPGPRPQPAAAPGDRLERERARASASTASGSRRRSCAASPPAGTAVEGPVVFELPEATFVAAARLAAPRSTRPARSSPRPAGSDPVSGSTRSRCRS